MAGTDPVEFQKAFKGVPCPAGRERLVAVVKKDVAGRDVVEEISRLGRKGFESPADVQKAVFGAE
ncbi:DUF2795 domain-containing protein [Streptomyces syringium]|uniref:DUF2795 domain-containing protein n=1 Tax=Streptomyces syringium TaxID=76729 RepID=UPI003452740C